MFTPSKFRVWTHFDLSNVTQPEVKNSEKITPAPNIPIDNGEYKLLILGILTLTWADLGFTMLEEV